MNKDSPGILTKLGTHAELGRLDSISVYRSSGDTQPGNDKLYLKYSKRNPTSTDSLFGSFAICR